MRRGLEPFATAICERGGDKEQKPGLERDGAAVGPPRCREGSPRSQTTFGSPSSECVRATLPAKGGPYERTSLESDGRSRVERLRNLTVPGPAAQGGVGTASGKFPEGTGPAGEPSVGLPLPGFRSVV